MVRRSQRRVTGRDLAAERVRLQLMQGQVAARLGISQARVSQIELAAYPSAGWVLRYRAALVAIDTAPEAAG